eukprot:CAMPEP_0177631896 /NCGR_PEP_ID=MMETSP0447-20121125/1994_1 /TAXON_ID=0 /ORGANISM="Stygamoeba regulata, Strain BSH-02190019" /LENGTH=546 /DNA_ID=CAMNT_0019133411 /DNA_START=42 /DNA_END=1678 /DNA_ORIENTATION=-
MEKTEMSESSDSSSGKPSFKKMLSLVENRPRSSSAEIEKKKKTKKSFWKLGRQASALDPNPPAGDQAPTSARGSFSPFALFRSVVDLNQLAAVATPRKPTNRSPRDREKEGGKPGAAPTPLPAAVLFPISPACPQRARIYKCINEIISTERDYLGDLLHIVEFYRDPMKAIITEWDANQLFSNVALILGVCREMHSKLVDLVVEDEHVLDEFATRAIVAKVCVVFADLSEYLKMYSIYCNNYDTAIIAVNRLSDQQPFRSFFQARFSSVEVGIATLKNYLIKPVQRVCKYPLLLRELEKNVAATGGDVSEIVATNSKIRKVVDKVEESSVKFGKQMQLVLLQSLFNSIDSCQQVKVTLVAPGRRLVDQYFVREVDVKGSAPLKGGVACSPFPGIRHHNDKDEDSAWTATDDVASYFLFNDQVVRAAIAWEVVSADQREQILATPSVKPLDVLKAPGSLALMDTFPLDSVSFKKSVRVDGNRARLECTPTRWMLLEFPRTADAELWLAELSSECRDFWRRKRAQRSSAVEDGCHVIIDPACGRECGS